MPHSIASMREKSLTVHGKGRAVSRPARARKYGVAERSTQKLIPPAGMKKPPGAVSVASPRARQWGSHRCSQALASGGR